MSTAALEIWVMKVLQVGVFRAEPVSLSFRMRVQEAAVFTVYSGEPNWGALLLVTLRLGVAQGT